MRRIISFVGSVVRDCNSLLNRIDVYVDGIYVSPKNTEQVDGKMKYLIPEYHCQYCPKVTDSHGTNFQV